jgi:hypothetical protein
MVQNGLGGQASYRERKNWRNNLELKIM